MNLNQSNLLIFITSILANLLMAAIFFARIRSKPKWEHNLGIIFEFLAIPLIFIIYDYISNQYAIWMIVYLMIFLVFLIVELILDYILKNEFRSNKKVAIPYVILYIVSFWGLLGINFAQNLIFGIIIFVLYGFHTGIMIQAHKKKL
jgi:hypothetical protein